MSNYTSKKDLDVASQLGLKRNTMEGATFQYTKGVGLTSTPPIGIEGVLTPQRQIFLYFPPNTFDATLSYGLDNAISVSLRKVYLAPSSSLPDLIALRITGGENMFNANCVHNMDSLPSDVLFFTSTAPSSHFYDYDVNPPTPVMQKRTHFPLLKARISLIDPVANSVIATHNGVYLWLVVDVVNWQ
jgi:hypothetical protein